jgi:hypothetical protein
MRTNLLSSQLLLHHQLVGFYTHFFQNPCTISFEPPQVEIVLLQEKLIENLPLEREIEKMV